jgi:delta-aminolevulinic acid dehydratase/porphobilinogen synthase
MNVRNVIIIGVPTIKQKEKTNLEAKKDNVIAYQVKPLETDCGTFKDVSISKYASHAKK